MSSVRPAPVRPRAGRRSAAAARRCAAPAAAIAVVAPPAETSAVAAMTSWEDGECSSENIFGGPVDRDYAPETCYDPDFEGLAVGCDVLCRVHKLEPKNCVAFDGTHIGRRFYMCSVPNEVENCGFVEWVDGEWPPTAKRAIGKLWGMYECCCSNQLDDRISSTHLMEDLKAEKNRWEKKYYNVVAEVNSFIDKNSKSCMRANYERIQKEGAEHDMMEQMKTTISLLESQVSELKNERTTQADAMRAMQQQWNEEKEVLKAEKKKLEYSLFDLFNAHGAKRDKLNRIKGICEE